MILAKLKQCGKESSVEANVWKLKLNREFFEKGFDIPFNTR